MLKDGTKIYLTADLEKKAYWFIKTGWVYFHGRNGLEIESAITMEELENEIKIKTMEIR